MSQCKKFSSCSAPQCPIDKPSLKHKYISGEPVCCWFSEYAKEPSRHNLESAIGDIPLEVIAEGYQTVFDSNGTIRGRLIRASKTPSRLGALSNVSSAIEGGEHD